MLIILSNESVCHFIVVQLFKLSTKNIAKLNFFDTMSGLLETGHLMILNRLIKYNLLCTVLCLRRKCLEHSLLMVSFSDNSS